MIIKESYLHYGWLTFLAVLGIIEQVIGKSIFVIWAIILSDLAYIYQNKVKLNKKFVFGKISKKEKKNYFSISLLWFFLGISIFWGGYYFKDFILILLGIVSVIIGIARLTIFWSNRYKSTKL